MYFSYKQGYAIYKQTNSIIVVVIKKYIIVQI